MSKDHVAIAELETFITVECKSTGKPWIVFCETKSHTWNIQQASCNNSGEKLLIRSREAIKKTELYARASRSGHGIAQAFGGKSDVPYTAMMSVLKAAEAQAKKAKETEIRIANDKELSHISESSATVPVVVISSPLFECSLGESGEPELRPVTHSSIAFRYPSGGNQLKVGTIVHIVTETGWPEFEDAILEFHKVLVIKLSAMIPGPKNGA